jgi:hypothetical protein
MVTLQIESFRPSPPSPLDPFLATFLRWIDERPGGFAPASQGPTVGIALGWQPAFGEAIFVSARARGLIEPVHGRGAGTRNRWQLTARGRAWLSEVGVSAAMPSFAVVADDAPLGSV